jgi:hypothetical protein
LSGSALSITPPSGYSKTSDNPASTYHNGCESKVEQYPAPAIIQVDAGVNGFWFQEDRTAVPLPYGAILAAEQEYTSSVALADCIASFADGASFFEKNGTNLSSHAGLDRIVVLEDSSGKRAWGIIGAGDTGTAYGSELVTNGGFETDPLSAWQEVGTPTSNIQDNTYVNEGSWARKLVTPGSANVGLEQTLATGHDYKRLKAEAAVYITSGTSIKVMLYQYGDYLLNTSTTGSWQSATKHGIWLPGTSRKIYVYCYQAATWWSDSMSVKIQTNCAANGFRILKGEGTEGWYVDSGFDYTDSSGYTVTIYSRSNNISDTEFADTSQANQTKNIITCKEALTGADLQKIKGFLNIA